MNSAVYSRDYSDSVFWLMFKGLHWGLVLSIKKIFFKAYIFFLPTYLVYQNLFCGTLKYPLLIWQLGFKLACICWTEKSVTCAVLRSTDIIQVLNELPIGKRHIRVPQNRLLFPQMSTTRKNRFSKNLMIFLNF